MCQFFSFTTKGSKRYYFNWEQRQDLLRDNPNDYNPDSHSSINAYFGLDDDKVNKYEYNPLTGEFSVDQINIKDDRALAKEWVEKLDFKTVVEPLIIKPIVHPFKLPKVESVSSENVERLRQWASVGALVVDSVGASVVDSVGASVVDSVWASVVDLVWASVRYSVRDSARDSVWNSISDSALAYTSSFFDMKEWEYIDHNEGENPFQSCIDLWEEGIVPSFDGKMWRLHSGENADVIFEISKEELLPEH